MKILGIDPGTRNCGYAIIEKNGSQTKLIEAGLIKIKTKILQEQIVEMTEGFDLIFDKLNNLPYLRINLYVSINMLRLKIMSGIIYNL